MCMMMDFFFTTLNDNGGGGLFPWNVYRHYTLYMDLIIKCNYDAVDATHLGMMHYVVFCSVWWAKCCLDVVSFAMEL